MRSPWTGKLIGRYYDELPHWVVDYGCYAVTIRCTGSLPGKTAETLRERWAHLRKIPPNSEAALRERRELFHTMDAALDRGKGFAPFNHPKVAAFFFEWLGAYQEDGLRLAAYLIMPNHLHLISAPLESASVDEFQLAWRRFKARAGRALNARMQRRGMFWQKGWFDRWIRDEPEWKRWMNYLANNPVKAGLCQCPEDYPWLRVEK